MKKDFVALIIVFVFLFSFINTSEAVFADVIQPAQTDLAADPAVTIVNPTADSTISSGNLLISVKVAKKATITVEVSKRTVTSDPAITGSAETGAQTVQTGAQGQSQTQPSTQTQPSSQTTSQTQIAAEVITYEPVGEKETFVSASDLSFYTKKIENMTAGTYKVTVNTIDADAKILYQSERIVEIEPKQEEKTVFESTQSGTFTFLQNLLKTIFGNE